MGFLFTLIIFTILDGLLIYYLANLEYFSPTNFTGDVDVGNITFFVFLVSVGLGLIVTLIIYLGEKFISCGWREFPAPVKSLKFGIITTAVLFVALMLHIFHFLSFWVVLLLIGLVLTGIILSRII